MFAGSFFAIHHGCSDGRKSNISKSDLLTQGCALFAFPHDQAFLHEALHQNDPLLIFHIARKISNGKNWRLQSEAERHRKKFRKRDGPATKVEPCRITIRMCPIDYSRTRSDQVAKLQRLRLKVVRYQARYVNWGKSDLTILKLLH